MAELVSLEQVARYTNWGTHGTYFNTQQAGFPQAKEVTEEGKLYSLEEIMEWDRNRPSPISPNTEVYIIRSVN